MALQVESIPQMVPTNDAEIVSKSHSPHGLEITPKKQKQRRP